MTPDKVKPYDSHQSLQQQYLGAPVAKARFLSAAIKLGSLAIEIGSSDSALIWNTGCRVQFFL